MCVIVRVSDIVIVVGIVSVGIMVGVIVSVRDIVIICVCVIGRVRVTVLRYC